MTYYQKAISVQLAKRGISNSQIDPRHVEGYMRLQYSTLDHLDRRTFNKEVALCVECIKEGGKDAAERNAVSFGL